MPTETLETALRELLRYQIKARFISVSEIARRSGLTQAHVSNFVNGKRSLSLQSFTKVSSALGLNVEDLIHVRAACEQPREPVAIDVLSIDVLRAGRFTTSRGTIWMSTHEVMRLPSGAGGPRVGPRLVALEATEESASGMAPIVKAGCIAVLDRQHTAISRSKKCHSPAIYLLQHSGRAAFAYAERHGSLIVIRKHDVTHGTTILPSTAVTVMGRVFQIISAF